MELKTLEFLLRNSVRSLFLPFLLIVLSACAQTRPFEQSRHGVAGKIEVRQISYNKILGRLSSYSAINGRLKSRPDDYIEVTRKGLVTFWGHKNHLNATKAVLDKPCCYDGKTSADTIATVVQWAGSLFNSDVEVRIDVLLVPDAYSYKYVTGYKIKGSQANVRFAFHYYDERTAIKQTQFVEKTIDTLTHELTHVYLQLSGRPAKNDISDETTASVIGACSRTLVTQQFPVTVSHIAFLNAKNEDIMPELRKTEYHEIIKRIKNNDSTIVGQILTTLIVEKMDEKYDNQNQVASQKMLEYCQSVVKFRHDFTLSMGLNEEN